MFCKLFFAIYNTIGVPQSKIYKTDIKSNIH